MKIVIASDHGGFDLKEQLKPIISELGFEVEDVGCWSENSVDYPDFAEKAVSLLIDGSCQRGILICGTGIGMSIAANRNGKIRAANCFDAYTAQMSREHNDSNVLCLGARVISFETASEMIRIWLATKFEGGRHQIRIDKFRS